jgi:micrococcal nuclease
MMPVAWGQIVCWNFRMIPYLRIFLMFLSFVLFSSHGLAKKNKANEIKKLSGVVQSCHDGDTCRVKVKDQVLKIRFSGIDTPEKSQQYGPQAKEFTQGLLLNQKVDLECEGKSYDRLTCTIFKNQVNINEEIVRAGWAWDSKKYSKRKYESLMKQAQLEKKGMWVNTTISPFCYRHKNSKKCRVSQLYME